MKLSRLAPVALAVAAVWAAPAWANNNTPSSPASVDGYQKGGWNQISNVGTNNDAAIKDSGQDTQGNVDVNVAAGSANQQSNEAAIAAIDSEWVLGRAASGTTQVITDSQVRNEDTRNNAVLSDGAFSNAKGKVGLNIAAGSGNQQRNQMAASVNDQAGSLVDADAQASQSNTSNCVDNLRTNNFAAVSEGALKGAVGNVGVNVAAGSLNQQVNTLAIAVSR